MQRLRHHILVRHRHNWRLLFRFGAVGASGVLVNQAVLALAQWVGPVSSEVAAWPGFRWYHVFVTTSFLMANVWNFQLNRAWTFESRRASWLSEYVPFLLVGLIALAANLGIVTGILHAPGALLPTWFEERSFDARLTMANLCAVASITPLSFAVNKVWTFKSVRGTRPVQHVAAGA